MHTFLIAKGSKEQQEKEIEKLLKPLAIDPIDITKITPENSIGIEAVRILKQEIALKPFKSETKAVIIEEAQTLTVEAQNALLKTLEEPPAHTIIILLVSGSVDLLLPTILSRAHVIELTTNYQQLTANELEVMSKQLDVISQGEIGERLKLAEDVSKDKDFVLRWLEKMILTTRQVLINEATKNSPHILISRYLNILRLFQRAHTLLATTNVNIRFTLETLFLSLIT